MFVITYFTMEDKFNFVWSLISSLNQIMIEIKIEKVLRNIRV